jgi:predicted Fe-Mo cluster-binding NifX family protein
MKKIAIPITKNNKIEEHFGYSEFYEIYTFSNTNEILDLQLLKSDKVCGCKSNLVNLLSNDGVTCVLSNRIGNKVIEKLNKVGIDVIQGCSGESSDVILKFLDGEISDHVLNYSEQNQNGIKEHQHVCNN